MAVGFIAGAQDRGLAFIQVPHLHRAVPCDRDRARPVRREVEQRSLQQLVSPHLFAIGNRPLRIANAIRSHRHAFPVGGDQQHGAVSRKLAGKKFEPRPHVKPADDPIAVGDHSISSVRCNRGANDGYVLDCGIEPAEFQVENTDCRRLRDDRSGPVGKKPDPERRCAAVAVFAMEVPRSGPIDAIDQ